MASDELQFQMQHEQSKACPDCGRCPTCGRGDMRSPAPPFEYVPEYPIRTICITHMTASGDIVPPYGGA